MLTPIRAEDPPALEAEAEPKVEASAAGDQLSVDQARLADRFKRLEEVVGRLAELSAGNDPRRARLLREAIAQSREQDINVRFESVIKLLEEERISLAATNQTELQKELDALLALLLKADRDKELTTERDRLRDYIKKLSSIIRQQKGLRARTEGGDELRPLGDEQKRVAEDTGKLSGDISSTEGEKNAGNKKEDGAGKKEDGKKDAGKNDSGKESSKEGEPKNLEGGKQGEPSESKPGEPSESKPGQPSESKPGESQPSDGKPSKPGDSPPSDSKPSQGQSGKPGESDDGQPSPPKDPADRAAERLRAAQKQMEDAIKKILETQRKGASDLQREALKQLEQAKADLERVLRQLREEEMERVLTQLAARFRKMLDEQTQVYEGTVRLDSIAAAERDHDDEIESARLSRQETEIVHEADKALLLLREEGSSVAFPETVEQMRDDMRKVAERLAVMKVGTITQGLEQDIIAALEETIAALEKAIKDLEKKKTPPGQMPMAGQPSEPPLVDKLAELRMIRALQMRINTRTQRYGKMIEGEQAETPDLIEALRDLAERQQRVYRATSDLEQGRND